MITPMQKLSILCLTSESEETLSVLHELGVLHVTPSADPTGTTSEAACQRLDEAKEALTTLDAYARHNADESHKQIPSPANIDDLISQVCALHREHRHLEEQQTNLRHAQHTLLPYGDFNPKAINDLAARGIVVRLYHVRDLSAVDVPEGVHLHVLTTDKTGTYFALIGEGEFSSDASEFHIPSQSLGDIEAAMSAAKLAQNEITDKLIALSASRDNVARALHDRTDAAVYADVRDTISNRGSIAFLRGFCPTDALPAVREVGEKHGWGLLVEEPADDDIVPTLLKLPRWVTPIKAVLQMLSILPGYRESDISGVFLIFFSIFFAILIGDAGYGLLFLIITAIVRRKKPEAPAYPFVLFAILSCCTIIWGAITGNYFGIAPSALPSFLQGVQVPWLTGESAQNNIMTLCFLIGAVHLTIAHVWNLIALAPSLQAIAQLGWIGLVWSMYFVALGMVLQQPFPGFFVPLIVTSVILILAFMTPPAKFKKDWIHHAMFPLSIVNCFVDIVSYIRLFAVGLASLSVAESFNDMALQVGWSRIWTVPFMAMILLAGHGLNIILCALGILVHGVRLNTLEFSLHKNLEWKGVPYKPFARVSQKTSN